MRCLLQLGLSDFPIEEAPEASPGTEAPRAAPTATAEKPGDRIGRFRLVRPIGEGGFGVVFEAEQEEPVRRTVALKVIKLGMDTKQVVARFEAERQALALMDHPNIAKVFDAGATATGRPYFVMELVKGVRITEFCDQNNLATAQRLGLFLKVCHAIQHAHQKGVIHRDIKPSNVLVTLQDGAPVPKVIDFGIAKATEGRLAEATVSTQLHQFLGTPAYMSPEQAAMTGLDIDTRTDIYSLGVLLYELLTGRTPFDAQELAKAGLDAIQRTIRDVEPPRPSTRLSTLHGEALTATARQHGTESARLLKLIRGDLDWIVMKCLEKDRARRYETANGLAVDLGRHLANEAVVARPPSAGYRLQKALRRNKTAFAVAALIAAVLVAATGFSAWQAILAKQRLTESEAVSKFLTEVFQSPDPARDGRKVTVAETLGAAAKKLENDLASQPARRAKIQATLGMTYHGLGLYREAIVLQEKARDYYLSASGPEHPDTLRAMHNLAWSYADAGRLREALKLQEHVLGLFRKVRGPEHPETLAAMGNLANSYAEAGRRDEALKLLEEVLARTRKVRGPEHADTLRAMNDLACSYFDAGRRDEALRLQEQVVALCRRVNGPEHPYALNAMNNLASSYAVAGRRDAALELRERALALSSKVNGPEHPATLLAVHNLATSYFDAGRRDEALKLREEVLALRRKVLGPKHSATLSAMHNLATSYSGAGRRDDALKLREEVLALSSEVLGSERTFTISAMQNLANSYRAAGRRDEALKLREQVLALRRKVSGPEHSETLGALHNLVNSYRDEGRWEEALKLQQELLPLLSKARGPEHPATLEVMIDLAYSYRKTGRTDEAIKLGQSSLDLFRRVSGPTHENTLNAMTELAISYHAAHRTGEAIALEEDSLRLKRHHLPAGHPGTVESMENLAACYEESGRKPEAEALRRDLAELKTKPASQNPGAGQSAVPPAKP
ncbi:MAG: serine/threonine-protein kinase [Verrucomicrobiota bacterium]|jgi:tetratricopeptide (TPR) repeat protein